MQSRVHRRVGNWLIWPSLAFMGVGWPAREAWAEEEPARVVYVAPAACPDEAQFLSRLRDRTEHGRFAEPGELARAFEVTVSEAAAGPFQGRLAFVDADGLHAERVVRGATCDEVVSSLALITALAIDARVSLPVAPTDQPEPSAPLAEPSAPTQSAKKRRPTSFKAWPRQERRTPTQVVWRAGANAALSTWVAPNLAFSYGAFAELEQAGRAVSARLSIFDTRQSDGASLRRAKFSSTWLRLEGCPVSVTLPAHFSIAGCAAFDGGRLHASGEPSALISATSSKNVFWASAVALARLRWLLGERWTLDLDGELGAPLVRHEFQYVDPDVPLFRVAPLGVGAKLGIGMRFL